MDCEYLQGGCGQEARWLVTLGFHDRVLRDWPVLCCDDHHRSLLADLHAGIPRGFRLVDEATL